MQLPQLDDRYSIEERIGHGGMGVVYRAHDHVLDRDVAIKIAAATVDAATAERLIRESRILARLEHPGIVTVHDAGVDASGRPWYAMRLVRGERLDQWSIGKSRGERMRLFLQLCDAIAFAHAHHVIHRDIKPSNVMVGAFGEVLVLDWGIALLSDDHQTEAIVAGTPGFMAPEQLRGDSQRIDERTDVFGLGALLATLIGDGERSARPLEAIVARACADDVAHRYADVESLAQDVRNWLDGFPVAAYRERWWERLHRVYQRNQAILLLFLAYAIVRLVILWWRGV